jgi:adenylate cyclase, class 2
MQSSEIELKFPVGDADALQSRLPGLGFHLDTPRTFEQNTLYDTPERTFRNSKQILRIRQYGPLWTVTHKRPAAPVDADFASPYKIRIETETHVEDGPTLGLIFESLGYAPMFRYEKYRTEWSAIALEDGFVRTLGHLVLDETPIGTYAELEGPPAWIDATLAKLNVDPATCITDSYGKLFLTWKARTSSPAENLTFDEIPQAVPALR